MRQEGGQDDSRPACGLWPAARCGYRGSCGGSSSCQAAPGDGMMTCAPRPWRRQGLLSSPRLGRHSGWVAAGGAVPEGGALLGKRPPSHLALAPHRPWALVPLALVRCCKVGGKGHHATTPFGRPSLALQPNRRGGVVVAGQPPLAIHRPAGSRLGSGRTGMQDLPQARGRVGDRPPVLPLLLGVHEGPPLAVQQWPRYQPRCCSSPARGRPSWLFLRCWWVFSWGAEAASGLWPRWPDDSAAVGGGGPCRALLLVAAWAGQVLKGSGAECMDDDAGRWGWPGGDVLPSPEWPAFECSLARGYLHTGKNRAWSKVCVCTLWMERFVRGG